MPQPLCHFWSHTTRAALIVGDCQLVPDWLPNWSAWIGIPPWLRERVVVGFVSEEVAVMQLGDTLIMTCQAGCTAWTHPPRGWHACLLSVSHSLSHKNWNRHAGSAGIITTICRRIVLRSAERGAIINALLPFDANLQRAGPKMHTFVSFQYNNIMCSFNYKCQ